MLLKNERCILETGQCANIDASVGLIGASGLDVAVSFGFFLFFAECTQYLKGFSAISQAFAYIWQGRK